MVGDLAQKSCALNATIGFKQSQVALIDRILLGAKPAELPKQTPTN
jgi:hypothetical protein